MGPGRGTLQWYRAVYSNGLAWEPTPPLVPTVPFAGKARAAWISTWVLTPPPGASQSSSSGAFDLPFPHTTFPPHC